MEGNTTKQHTAAFRARVAHWWGPRSQPGLQSASMNLSGDLAKAVVLCCCVVRHVPPFERDLNFDVEISRVFRISSALNIPLNFLPRAYSKRFGEVKDLQIEVWVKVRLRIICSFETWKLLHYFHKGTYRLLPMRVCTERAGRKGDRLVHLGKGTV